jgi:aspartate/methionine/tyrosine aminotransferase
LREALAEIESNDRGFKVDPETQVLVFGGGGIQALNLTIQAILNPKDEAVIFIPGLATDQMVTMAGGKPVFVRLDEERGFRPDFDKLRKRISPKTKLIILNTPHNPSGYVWQRDELKQLAEIACDHDLLILSDDVFKYFVFDGEKPAFITDFPDVRDQVISVYSATKTYGMFDWRVSWLFAHADLVRQVEKILFWNCEFAPPMTQVGAEAAVRSSHEWMKDQVKRMKSNLNILHSGLSTIPGIHIHKALGGPTMFPRISEIESSSMKSAHYLLEAARVLVAPGAFYLSDGHIRTSFWGSGNLLTEKRDSRSRIKTDRRNSKVRRKIPHPKLAFYRDSS